MPSNLHDALAGISYDSPHDFAAHADQLRQHHLHGPYSHYNRLISTPFVARNRGDWFYRQLVEWSESLPGGHAHTHIFRKTSLQYARSGEDLNREVAKDAKLSESVLMTNYVQETDEEMRRASNRTFNRILSSLGPVIATRYGQPIRKKSREELEAELIGLTAEKNWAEVARIAAELNQSWG